MAKSITASFNLEMQSVTFISANCKATLCASLVGLEPGIITKLALRGLKEKLADGMAKNVDTKTGHSIDDSVKIATATEIYNALCNGLYGIARTGGSSEPKGGYLFNALCELYPAKTPEELKTFLAGKTKAEQARLREYNPKIKAIIDRMKAESVKSLDIDTDALLGELED